jgi:hypothetical protein
MGFTRRRVGEERFRTIPLLAFLSSCSILSACGYAPLYPSSGAGTKLHVVLVRSLVPDAAASDEVASGAREQLARDGALAPGDGYPRVEIEVLREDETSDAIAAPNGVNAPVARGLDVALVARAWVVASPDSPREHDTGDMRAADLVAPQATARTELVSQLDASRAVARRVGRRLALKVLGHPAASE